MQRPDLILDTKNDRVLYPKPYFSSDQLQVLKLQKVIVLQRYWRGYQARMLAASKRAKILAYQKRLEDEQLEKLQIEALEREKVFA